MKISYQSLPEIIVYNCKENDKVSEKNIKIAMEFIFSWIMPLNSTDFVPSPRTVINENYHIHNSIKWINCKVFKH